MGDSGKVNGFEAFSKMLLQFERRNWDLNHANSFGVNVVLPG